MMRVSSFWSGETGGMTRFCLFLAFGATLATGQMFALMPLVPQVSLSLGNSAALGLPLFAAGYATGMVLFGSLSGRLGVKRVLVISLSAGALLSVACAWSPITLVFLLFRFVEGVVLGGFPPAAFVATTQRVPLKNRLLANSAMVFGLLGSAGLAGLISRMMAESIGWRNGLVVYGALLLLASALASRLGGLSRGDLAQTHPYRLIRGEAFSGEGMFSNICGACTMAAFAMTNGMAQRGQNPILALIVVLCAVLLILGVAKFIVRRLPDERRALGLLLVCCGACLGELWGQGIVLSLATVTVGATLVVPASIQKVISNARKSIPVAVACFTCCLFIGGTFAGLSMTGMVPVSPLAVSTVLIVSLGILAGSAWVRLRADIWSRGEA